MIKELQGIFQRIVYHTYSSLGQLYLRSGDSPTSGQVHLRGYLKTVGFSGDINVPLSGNNFDLSLIDQKFGDVAVTNTFRFQATGFTSLETVDPKVRVTMMLYFYVIDGATDDAGCCHAR